VIKKLIVTHGHVAAHLVHAARRINAEALGDIRVLCLEWDITLDKARRQVGDVLRELGREDGVLILTDVFGATPSNACGPYLERGVVEMVTGVNLPMVMRLGMQGQPNDVTALADWIQGKAVKSIVHVGEPPPGCKPAEGQAAPDSTEPKP
jgi:PTS system mannose-specific IIA component